MIDETIKQFYAEFLDRFKLAVKEIAKRNPELAEKMEARKYSLFNQDPRTTLKQGEYYFIGINPGGAEGYDYPSEDFEFWQAQKLGYSGFYDEFWAKNTFSNHQRNVMILLKHLVGTEEKARKVFSTNMYFYRTPGIEALAQYPLDLIDCLDFHSRFLEIVQPRVIISNGNTRFSFYERLYSQDSREAESYCGAGTRGCVKGFKREGRVIVGLPHLSRPYIPIKKIIPALAKVMEKLG
jgi:hypothetical protein